MDRSLDTTMNLHCENYTNLRDSACKAFAEYNRRQDPPRPEPSPNSYYLIRLCTSAFSLPELRASLLVQLHEASREEIAECRLFRLFICHIADDEEVTRQGIPLEFKYYETDYLDLDKRGDHTDQWAYAEDVFGEALSYHQNSPNQLDAVVITKRMS